MFGLFKKKKNTINDIDVIDIFDNNIETTDHDDSFKDKDKGKELQKIGVAFANNRTVRQQTAKADAHYKKPDYNPKTRRSHYDDPSAHKSAKDAAFSGGNSVKDPYSGKELVPTIEEAKRKYGDKWQEHLAETDHIEPLNKIADRTKDDPWLTSDDVREVANGKDNLQMLSRSNNQTGGKGGNTQEDWSKDTEKMKKLSEQSGESAEKIAKKIRKIGKKAKRRNDKELTKRKVKNVAKTANSAGLKGAKSAATTTAVMATINNFTYVINGEKSAKDAIKDIGDDTVKSAAHSYIHTASLTAINHTLSSSSSKFLSTLGKKNIAGKTISAISLTGDTIVKWGNGDITTEECMIELGGTACNCGGEVVGGIIGTTITGGNPIAGMVCSFVGGILTSQVYNEVVLEIQCLKETKEEEERKKIENLERIAQKMAEDYIKEYMRKEEVRQQLKLTSQKAIIVSINEIISSQEFKQLIDTTSSYIKNHKETQEKIAEYVLLTLQLQEYRRQLQEYIDLYFSECRHAFDEALDIMDTSLALGDYDGAIDEANQVTRLFGRKPIIKDTDDFKKKIFGNEKITL